MSKITKILVGAVIAFAGFAVIASPVSAQTYSWSRPLSLGAKGADVMSLQKFLNLCADTQVSMSGAGSPGMETSTFGPATKAAVIKFQVKHGVFPTAGYFGGLSQAKVAMLLASGNPCGTGSTGGSSLPAGCVPGAMYSSTTGMPCSGGSTGGTSTGPLSGGAGDLKNADFVSAVSNEDVGEDESNVKVLGLDLEADKGSDLSFTSIRVEFEEQGAGGSDKFDDYADEVSVWLGSTKVGSASVDDFDEDNNVYSKTISLSNAIIRKGDSQKLYVAVSALSNIDSDDLGSANNDWNVAVANLRYVDAQGAVVTENSLDDIGSTDTRDFQFVSFASAADVELKVRLNNDEDDVNNAHTITVDENDETDNEPLLAFTLKAEGDSDIMVKEIPVKFTTNDSNISTVLSEVALYHGTTEIASEDIDGTSTSQTITFEDLDLTVDAGDTEEFWVKATILEQGGGSPNYANGTATIMAELGSAQVDAIDAEDESGEDLGASELTGTASGDAHTLNTSMVTITGFTWKTLEGGAGLELTFTVAAEDDSVDVTLADLQSADTVTGTGTVGAPTLTKVSGDATNNGGNSYTVEDGDDATFSLVYTNTGSNGTNFRVTMPTVAGQDIPEDKEVSPLVVKNIN